MSGEWIGRDLDQTRDGAECRRLDPLDIEERADKLGIYQLSRRWPAVAETHYLLPTDDRLGRQQLHPKQPEARRVMLSSTRGTSEHPITWGSPTDSLSVGDGCQVVLFLAFVKRRCGTCRSSRVRHILFSNKFDALLAGPVKRYFNPSFPIGRLPSHVYIGGIDRGYTCRWGTDSGTF